MRRIAFLKAVAFVSVLTLGMATTTPVVGAQGVLGRLKKAVEDAAKKTNEPQKPQRPSTGSTEGTSKPASPPSNTSQPSNEPSTTASREAASGDCCSPEALKNIASSVGFVDIVGIKLGMTPDQAFTAVKAFNGQMKIDILKVRMESPDGPLGNFTQVPRYAVAHTVGKRPNPNFPDPFTLADGSADVIVMEFTTPPSPPLVGKVVRQTTFPLGQPVVASNLVDALHKKYGDEHHADVGLVWVFDSAGKPVIRPLQGQERFCAPGHPYDGFAFRNGGQMPSPDDLTNDTHAPINLDSTREEESTQRSAACRPFTFVESYPLGEGTPRNQQMSNMTVTIQSPGLLYGARKATHDWLQAKGDAKAKQQQDAAKARTAPKL
jgi:hypothetical protein